MEDGRRSFPLLSLLRNAFAMVDGLIGFGLILLKFDLRRLRTCFQIETCHLGKYCMLAGYSGLACRPRVLYSSDRVVDAPAVQNVDSQTRWAIDSSALHE